jgi:hypothetical protein
VTPSLRFFAITALVSFAACRAAPVIVVAPAPATPEATVTAFLSAVDSNAADRMAALWGTDRGPSTVVIPNAQERDRRVAIMRRLLRHDAFRFVPAAVAVTVPAGRRMLYVELTRGDRRATVPFILVSLRSGGWLVEDIGLEAAMPIANPRRQSPP